jgi:enoyl-CoA hydratase
MAYETLLLDVSARIATITVNRPDKLNALNPEVIRDLGLAIDECLSRDDVGGIILTGAGRAFVAGADISRLSAQDARTAAVTARVGQEVFAKFETSPKPTIAAVNGFALGGGCELAMSCHVRIAADTAKFGQPEVKIGLIPGYGGTQRLPRLIGRGRAIELLLTGAQIDANEAYRIGLANKVVPVAELLDTARAMLTVMLANAPLAVAGCIALVDRGASMALDDALVLEAAEFGNLFASADAREGTTAFLEKRAPNFQGR